MSNSSTERTDRRAHAPKADDERTPFRYDANMADDHRARWQEHWDERNTFRAPNPGDHGFDASKPKFYVPGHVPLPLRRGAARGAPRGLHRHRHRLPVQAHEGLQRAAPDGVGRLRAARRAVRDPDGRAPGHHHHARRSTTSGVSCSASASATTGRASSPPSTKTTTAGRSGSGSRRTPRGSTRQSPEGAADRRPRRELESGAILVGATERHRARGGQARRQGPAVVRRSEDERREFIDNHRLAYLDEQTVNWCPKLGTALANEEVIDGKSRARAPSGAAQAAEAVDVPHHRVRRASARRAGRTWTGPNPPHRHAARVDRPQRRRRGRLHPIVDPPTGCDPTLRVYTTRPDTLFGATYMVLAPEHPLVDADARRAEAATDADALRAYVEAARHRQRRRPHGRQQGEDRRRFTGDSYAINPTTGTDIPIWTPTTC
jgi:leucyl-tRNA synthetase